MQFGHLYEFIVPFIFVAIWAVTWILNRDAQPLPPRPVRRAPDDRSGTDRAGSSEPVVSSTSMSPKPSANRPNRPMPAAFDRQVGRGGVLGPGDAIVFTEPLSERRVESFEKSAAPRQLRGAPKRNARAKEPDQARRRSRPDPEKTRELTKEVSTSMSQLKGKPLELTPLNLPLSPLTSLALNPYGPSMSASDSTPQFSNSGPGLLDFRKILADPARLREVFVWNELVQPPLALRKGPLRRH